MIGCIIGAAILETSAVTAVTIDKSKAT